jgi:hypothetical protein
MPDLISDCSYRSTALPESVEAELDAWYAAHPQPSITDADEKELFRLYGARTIERPEYTIRELTLSAGVRVRFALFPDGGIDLQALFVGDETDVLGDCDSELKASIEAAVLERVKAGAF